MKKIKHESFALILTGASGAGKGTIGKALLEEFENLKLSISATTRKPRPGEQNGLDYFFFDEKRFTQLIEKDEMMEWAHVFGQYYGTPLQPILDHFSKGEDILFDIDWQGARKIKKKLTKKAINIHILPPTKEILKQRLIDRKQDTLEVINRRMNQAAEEISHWEECDYVIVNHDLSLAIAQVKAIFMAECCRVERCDTLKDIVKDFL